jgi:uncharacterized membrane protein
MSKGRLEAFSDGVIAILITIMVLELKVPESNSWRALLKVTPVLLTYLLSFVFLGIYWNNHHHLLHACQKINGAAMWANLHLLFWLSLVPFVTNWIEETGFAEVPTAVYGVVLFCSGIAFTILLRVLVALHGPDSRLASAVGSDLKGKLSLLFYAVAIPAAFVHPLVSDALYVVVALMWLIPDRRIESMIGE